jgi:signal transduction histidine kinase
MVPDLRTLFLVIAVLCAVQGFGMVVLWALNRRTPGISSWAASNVLNAFTMALLPLQGVVDNRILNTAIPSLCGVAAAVFYYAGSSQFLGKTSWKRHSIIAVGLWLFPFLYFLFIKDSLQTRVYLASMVLIFLNGMSGVMLMKEARGGMQFSMRFTGIMFLLFTGMLMVRLFRLVQEPPVVTIFDHSTSQWMIFIAVAILAYLRSFGTILMINQRQTLELHERHAAQRRAEEALEQARREAEEQRSLRQRQALIRDLHDGIGGITANLAMLAALGREEETAAVREEMLKHIQVIALEGNREVRSLMNTLENGKFHWTDWLADLRDYSRKVAEPHGIRVDWQIHGASGGAVIHDPTAAISLTRAVKEAIHNLTRHSRATEARIEVNFQEDQLGILVADNGRGFPSQPSLGRGMKNMARRAEELGGTLVVSAKEGTKLCFTLPLPLKYPDASCAAS